MSCFGSTKTDFSPSNMSLASSTVMTALSTCTISDADYETSDEQLLSPNLHKVGTQISQSSTNLGWSTSLLASQSVSCLANPSDDFAISSDVDKYAMTVKSDTCLNQQSKIISDFIDDMRLQEQLQIEDRDLTLSSKNSATSVQTEFYPATNASDSPYGSIIDINIADSAETIEKEITDARVEYSDDECATAEEEEEEEEVEEEVEEEEDEEKVSVRSGGERPVRLTLSETKHKIIENLAQVTSDKLFSKADLRLRYLDDSGSSMTKAERSQGEPACITASATRSRVTSRRPFQRCRGVESLLQIDYELQPLNLMLSRLLAEFRAMDLRGKLGSVHTDQNSSMSKQRATSMRTFTDAMQDSQLHSRRRKEEDTCMKFLYSLSHEHLGDNPLMAAAMKEANIAQISRSCEDNCLLSRGDSFAKGGASSAAVSSSSSCCRRTELSEKHPECSNETEERNPLCHRETRCIADDRRSQKVYGSNEEEDFGSGMIRLQEIASTN